MSRAEAVRRGLEPLCSVVCSAMAGVDPSIMGTGPVPAVTKALARAGWTAESVDLWELNEAFAAQALAVVRELVVAACSTLSYRCGSWAWIPPR